MRAEDGRREEGETEQLSKSDESGVMDGEGRMLFYRNSQSLILLSYTCMKIAESQKRGKGILERKTFDW